jgi:predicted lipid-binding transport protein (Tim44 family)
MHGRSGNSRTMGAVSALLVSNLLLTAAYAGFQWTVQVLVYRQFVLVPPEAFAAYEAAHQRLISYVVGPLYGGQLLCAGALIVTGTGDGGLRWGAAGLLLTILAVTGLLAVPLHRRLSAGFDAAVYRTLLRVDLVRAVLATLNAAVATGLALRG